MWRSANDKRLKRLQRVVDAMPENPPETPTSLDATSDAELAGFLAAAGEVVRSSIRSRARVRGGGASRESPPHQGDHPRRSG